MKNAKDYYIFADSGYEPVRLEIDKMNNYIVVGIDKNRSGMKLDKFISQIKELLVKLDGVQSNNGSGRIHRS